MTPQIVSFLLLLIEVYRYILLAAVILSWIPSVPRYNPIVRFLYDVTEPILRPIRRIIPPEKTGYLDVSPIIAFLLLSFLQRIIVGMVR